MARKNTRKGARREPSLFADSAEKAAPARQRRQRRWSFTGFLMRAMIKLGLLGAVVAALVIGFVWVTLDQKGLFKVPERAPGIMVVASDGSVLAEQGAFFGDEVRLEELPDYVPNAIIAIEDRRFRSHFGIDVIGITRAVVQNLRSGRGVQGGSTITQQLAKNLFLTPERTAWRKLQEAVLAVWLERTYSKDEILQLYLNRVYFAGGSLGIERAANALYGKSTQELSLMEAATLAGVLKAPTTYNPSRNPENASARARLVLNAMVEEGYVSDTEAKQAVLAPSTVAAADYIPSKQYVIDWVNEQLPQLVKKYDQSIVVETTIDPAMQTNAETVLRQRLTENAKKLKVGQGALVVMDTTGAIKAMVGGRSYRGSQFNRVTKAKRQPGSAFKPFVYLAAIEDGYKPDSIEVDEPIRIGNWEPENYRHKYLGEVTLQTAFAQSLNTVAAKLGNAVGIDHVISVAQRLGISSKLTTDASLALGTSEVTLLEITSAFAPFANGGELVAPHIVTKISTRDGDVLYERMGSGLGKVVTDYDLGAMNAMFRSVVREGTAKNAQFGGFDLGGKTGTSQNYRDAWFIGFSPYLIAGVWVGNDDNSPTRNITGGSLPALIWRDVMEPAHANFTPVLLLPGVSQPDYNAVAEVQVDGPEIMTQDEIQVAPAPRRKKKYLLDYLFGDDDAETVPVPRRSDRSGENGKGGLY